MKVCPFCAEEIQLAAIKCRFCGEMLDAALATPQVKWYFSNSMVILMLLSLGPLALPLVWWHPHYKPLTKVMISLGMLIFSLLLVILARRVFSQLSELIDVLNI